MSEKGIGNVTFVCICARFYVDTFGALEIYCILNVIYKEHSIDTVSIVRVFGKFLIFHALR